MNLLSEALISQHLLFLEHLACKAYFQVYDSLLIYNAALRSAIIDEELLVVYNYSLSLLYIAHEATIEVWVQVILLQVLKSLSLIGISSVMAGFILPYRGYAHHLYRLRSAGLNLNLCVQMINATEEGTSVLNIELVIFEL